MADFALTASAKSALPNPAGETLIAEAFRNVLATGLDKRWKRNFQVLKQGDQFFVRKTITRETAKFRTWREMGGTVAQNRDADTLPVSTFGEGFGFQVQTFNYRDSIAIEKTLTEVDDAGVIAGMQQGMAQKADRTLEYIYADVFNRAVAPSSGAPILADDGLYLIDSSRPNANPAGGTWGNEETTGAISEDLLWAAQLNARNQVDENGEPNPGKVMKIVIRPDDEKALWTLLNSASKTGTNFNDAAWVFKRFEYIVWDYLSTANIYYLLGDPKSEDNELGVYWRVNPEFKTWTDGSNPDITRQRVRFAVGLGLGSPRKMWRGGALS